MATLIVGALIAVGVLLAWALFSAVGAWLFTWAWNTLVPLLWHAAPLLTFWQGLAACLLLGAIKGIIHFSTTVNKSKS